MYLKQILKFLNITLVNGLALQFLSVIKNLAAVGVLESLRGQYILGTWQSLSLSLSGIELDTVTLIYVSLSLYIYIYRLNSGERGNH